MRAVFCILNRINTLWQYQTPCRVWHEACVSLYKGALSQTGIPGLRSFEESTLVNTVLVVDDEQTLALNIQAYLENQGLTVHVAHDGSSAIKLAAELQPDVAVLDFRLPDMEGFQVLEAVRKNRDCHFVLITAHPTAEVRERANQLGVSHILFKPFPLAELARAVCDLTGIKREAKASVNTDTGFVERRQGRNLSFPLQLYDGSWVLADRRRNSAKPPGPDDDQLLTGE